MAVGGSNPDDETTTHTFESLVQQVLSESWENLSLVLSEWHISELKNLGNSRLGVECLLYSWFYQPSDLLEGTYCNATWDQVYCWPATPSGETVFVSCQDAFRNTQPSFARSANGFSYRICQENSTWLWGNWTNYTECAVSYEEFVLHSKAEEELMARTQYILFAGSILSLACLVPAVIIFQYFRCLRCDRVNILKNLMTALLIRYAFLLVITDPVIFSSSANYRSLDIVCKAVLTIYLYSTVASVNWMFVQGVYINGKLTSNVFDREAPFKLYYCIGWVLPVVILATYGGMMEVNHPVKCWSGYSEMSEIWIVAIPIVLMLLANLLFLINIVRILVTTVQNRASYSDAGHVRRAAISMIFLVPLLGVSNLLFAYNPGGSLHKYYITANAVLGSTQGIFVAVGYCFLSKDVQQVFRRSYRRFRVRRSASRRRGTSNAYRRGNRRLGRNVVGSGQNATVTYRNCLPDTADIRLHPSSTPNHVDRMSNLVDNPNTLQNALMVDTTSNLSPALCCSSTPSNVVTVGNREDCEVRRDKVFFGESGYGERGNRSARSVMDLTEKRYSPLPGSVQTIRRSNTYV